MLQVVTYCRVSSDEQAQKDISIPAQRKAIHRWIDANPGHKLIEEFVDEGESAYASADKRPGFCQMIAYCKKHDVNAILVHKLDRFSRNQEESIIFKSLLRKRGVQVRSITENFDPETPQGFLYEGMIEVINQFYSMNLATETLKGMRENAERGYKNGGRTPYGYRLKRVTEGKREHALLVPGPKREVDVIREIFDMGANQNMGARAIASALNKRGIHAPVQKHWTANSVHFILKNQVYVGDQVWGRSKKNGRDGRKRTGKDEWIVTENAHEGLISRELFNKRKAVAAQRGFHDRRSRHQPVQKYLLSRLIRCGHCGHNFSGSRRTRKNKQGVVVEYFRYYCNGYLSKGGSACPSLPIHQDWVESTILNLIRDRLCSDEALGELEQRVRDRIEARRQRYSTDPRTLARQIADLDRQIHNYYRAIGNGMDATICQQHITDLTAQKGQLEEEARVLQGEDYYKRALERNLTQLRRFAETFDRGFNDLDLQAQRKVILKFIEDIEVVDRKILRIKFRVPFETNGIQLLSGSDGDDTVVEGVLGNTIVREMDALVAGASQNRGADAAQGASFYRRKNLGCPPGFFFSSCPISGAVWVALFVARTHRPSR